MHDGDLAAHGQWSPVTGAPEDTCASAPHESRQGELLPTVGSDAVPASIGRHAFVHPVGLQNAPRGALELPGLTISEFGVGSGTAKFDLTLSVTEGSEGLRAAFRYNTDLFDATTIERMRGHFLALLEGIEP